MVTFFGVSDEDVHETHSTGLLLLLLLLPLVVVALLGLLLVVDDHCSHPTVVVEVVLTLAGSVVVELHGCQSRG